MMNITRCKDTVSYDYTIDSNSIENVEEFKLLGVYVNCKLTCHTQVNYVCWKASRILGFVTRCSRNMSWKAMLNLYKALILPIITYCCAMWSPGDKHNTKRIESVQRRATRIIMFRKEGSWETSYNYRLKTLNILSIEDTFKLHKLTIGFKIMKGFCPPSFDEFVRCSERCEGRLIHWNAKGNIFLNSVFVAFPRLWEQIPNSIQQSSTIISFKSALTKHFISVY